LSNDTIKLPNELLLDFYKQMLFFRRFEERVNLAYMQRKFSGFCHLHIGQEAVCVALQANLSKEDYVISGYRSHTQAIAKGIPAKQVFAELLGKKTGCSKGKGGSMHMFGKKQNFLGGNGIVGAQAPLAIGVAFAIKYNQKNNIIVCYLGDGAMNQGAVFESLNMAATWDLPVLFVIENNKYGMGTAIHRVTSIDKLYKRAIAFNMEHSIANGMDVISLYKHTQSIIKKMKVESKPHLIEVETYRYKGHSVSDPGKYRSKEELLQYQKKDPILQLYRTLLEKRILSENENEKLNLETRNKVVAIEKSAEKDPEPEVNETWQDIYV